MSTDLPRQSIAFESRTACDALTLAKIAAALSRSSASTAVSNCEPRLSSEEEPLLAALPLSDGRLLCVSAAPHTSSDPSHRAHTTRGLSVGVMETSDYLVRSHVVFARCREICQTCSPFLSSTTRAALDCQQRVRRELEEIEIHRHHGDTRRLDGHSQRAAALVLRGTCRISGAKETQG